jgi:hypothetical protein
MLRSLLNKHGVPEESIEYYRVTGVVVPPRQTLAGHYRPPTAVGSDVGALERLLEPRRPSCLDPSEPFCAPSNLGACSTPVDDKRGPGSRGTAPSIWESAPRHDGLHSSTASQRGQQHPGQYIRAPSQVPPLSETDAAMALKGLGSILEESRSPPTSILSSAGPIEDGISRPSYGYGMHLLSSTSGYGQPQQTRQRLTLQSTTGSSVISANYMQTPTRENNCCMATGIISGMTGVEPHHVRNQLDCEPGIDCHVDSMSFSNAVDRYTATTIGN